MESSTGEHCNIVIPGNMEKGKASQCFDRFN